MPRFPHARLWRQTGILIGNILLAMCCITAYASEKAWLLIDTTRGEARLMRGTEVIARYRDIAIGRRGATSVHYQGDDSTPLGDYRIDGINRKSRYGVFLSLNYPLPSHAREAFDAGKLSAEDRTRIEDAHAAGIPPPYDTTLGGWIGIHGIGKGSLKTHRQFNWTQGCVALDNLQMSDLATRVRIGTRVVIR
jgi:hypothetical protein